MAELNLRINTQQAQQAARAFERIINDIKQAARTLDNMNLSMFGQTFRALTSSGASLLAMVNQIADALGRVNYTLQSLRGADYGRKLASDFTVVRDMMRAMRDDIAGLNRDLRETVTLAGRMGTAAQRVRRQRTAEPGPAAEEAVAETAAVMSTALVPATTRAMTVFERFRPVASTITLVTTATTGLAREMRLLTSGAESADRAMRQLVVTARNAQTAFRVGPGGQAARANEFFGVAPRPAPPLQLGPGGMGEAGAVVPYQRPQRPPIITPQPGAGLVPYVHEGEAVDRFGKALMTVQQPLRATAKELEQTKEKKDRLDRNLKDTAQNTLPKFNFGWLQIIATMALFEVRHIFQELTDLGKTLFELGRDAENTFAIFKAGARDNVEEASRRMLTAGDAAKKFGLDLRQTEQDYARLAAAALGTSIEGEKLERVFYGIATAQAVLGQNTEKGTGLIKVFTDMLGKGRVQSEELVKQMGNIIPGSIRVVAEALGKTPQELASAVARGTITVTEVLTKVAEEFVERYGAQAAEAAKRLGNALNILKTSFIELGRLVVQEGFGDALRRAFDTLRQFLENADTRKAILQLATFITSILGKAFEYLIWVLGFVRNNLSLVIQLFVTLGSAAIAAGVYLLVRAVLELGKALLTIQRSGWGFALTLVAITASFWLGAKAAEQFEAGLAEVSERIKKAEENAEKLRQKQAQGQPGDVDITRAVQEATETIEQEARTFNQELENQARLLDLVRAGVSPLSSEFDAYAKVLERVRALERRNIFEQLGGAHAADMKRRFTEAMLLAERARQVMEDLLQMYRQLDQEQGKLADTRMTSLANLEAMRQGPGSQATTRLQEEYDQRVLPTLRRIREQLVQIQDPRQARILVQAANDWSRAMLDNIVQLDRIRRTMGLVTRFMEDLQELSLLRLRVDVMGDVRSETETITGSISESVERFKAATQAGLPDFQPPKLRTIGEEMQKGFNPGTTGKLMGESFVQVFSEAVESSMKPMLDELKKIPILLAAQQAESQGPGRGVTGRGPALKEAPEAQRGLFEYWGRYYGVDPELGARVARRESRFDPKAVGHDESGNIVKGGGQGVMQIVPGTWRRYGQGDPFDPNANIAAGFKLIDALLTKHGGDLEKAMREYRGESRAKDPTWYKSVVDEYEGRARLAATTVQAQEAQAPAATPTTTSITPSGGAGGVVGQQFANWLLPNWLKSLLPQDAPGPRSFGTAAFGVPEQRRYVPGVDPALAEQERQRAQRRQQEISEQQPLARPAQVDAIAAAEAEKKQAEETRKTIDAMRDKIAAQEKLKAQQDELTKKQEKDAEDARKYAAALDEGLRKSAEYVATQADIGQITRSRALDREANLQAEREYQQLLKEGGDVVKQYEMRIKEASVAKFMLARLGDTRASIRALRDETTEVEFQTTTLGEHALVRDAILNQRRREQEFAKREVTDPRTQAEFDEENRRRFRADVGQAVQGQVAEVEKENRALQINIEMLGVNAQERDLLTQARIEETEIMRLQGKVADEEIQKLLQANAARERLRLQLQRLNGPMKQYIDSLADLFTESGRVQAMQEKTVEFFRGLEDVIVDFTKTGKLNFKDFADSFIESVTRMVIQALILRPIMEALNKAMNPQQQQPAGGASGGGGSLWSTVLNLGLKVAGAYFGMPSSGGAGAGGYDFPGASGGGTGFTGGDMPGAATGGLVTPWGIERPQMFAWGGVVPGGESPLNTFQGGGMQGVGTDTVPALLTPGEVVLNRAQQEELVGAMGGATQNNTFNMIFPNVSNANESRQTAAQAYSEISARLERQRMRDGVRARTR